MLVQSDVSNVRSLFIKHPTWHAIFDNDPNLTIATRKKCYDMAAAEKIVPVAWDPNG